MKINQIIGEITTDEGIKLVLDPNSLCEYQILTGETIYTTFQTFKENDVDFVALRNLVYVSMLEHQPDATLRDAGKVLAKAPSVAIDLFKMTMGISDDEEPAEPATVTAKKK